MPKSSDERTGLRLRVNGRPVEFSLWPTRRGKRGYAVQPEILSNSPWDVIEYQIKQKYAGNQKARKICLSFLNQAKDFYFASQNYSVSSRPLLLYYSFLNLAKAFIVFTGTAMDLDRAQHGVTEIGSNFKQASVKLFPAGAARKNIAALFLQALCGNTISSQVSLKLVKHILRQIVIGHRLWAAASGKTQKFIRCERIDFRHSRKKKLIWLRVCVTRDDLRGSGITHQKFARLTKLEPAFREVSPHNAALASRCVVYEQKNPISYSRRPSDKLRDLVGMISPHLWTIVRSTPPYRRYYLNLLSPSNRRVHPVIAIYLLCFYLGSVTRYRPYEFEKIQDSEFGMFVAEFLETEGLQFWYKLACEFGQQNVSLPAVVH